MNSVRKLMGYYYDDIKNNLDKTYHAIKVFQDDRTNIVKKESVINAISETTEVLRVFKPYIPPYKQKYFDIVDNHKELDLSMQDLIMTFDRMVYELHTRLEQRISNNKDLQAWSPLMKEILDGRRSIPNNKNDDIQKHNDEFIASGQIVTSGYIRSIATKKENIEDFKSIGSGAILLSKMTTPDIIIAIQRISGIATEQGGQFCHAAIIAREFNIPCIVGCGSFLNKIENGDEIILDANIGLLLRRQ